MTLRRLQTGALALVFVVGGAGAEPYDFKGIELGVSKSAFRALSHPDGETATVVCTGDQKRSSRFFQVSVRGKYREAGLSECSWFRESSTGWGVVGMAMAASGINATDPEFLFTPDADGVERLYRVRMATDIGGVAGDVLNALVAKWGEPSLSDDLEPPDLPVDLQGVWEPSAKGTYVWTKEDSTIVMSAAPSETSLLLIHHGLARVANRRFDDLLSKMKNPI